jgi:hypothetical protein
MFKQALIALAVLGWVLLLGYGDERAIAQQPPATGGCIVIGSPNVNNCAFILQGYTVATLPSCTGKLGMQAYVTDASSPTYNGTLTGGSTTKVPVFCNGTAWTSH